VDVVRTGLGALLGILVSGATALAIPNGAEALPSIVAPMGASAVLLFAVPGSPLAQPWPLLGRNLVSTAIGLAAHWLIGVPVFAAAVGVGTCRSSTPTTGWSAW
jgi:CBS domain-containing membrane protein